MAKITIPSSGAWATIAGYFNSMFTELYNSSGWEDIVDTEYTVSNKFRVQADTPTKIPNNGGSLRSQEVPPDYPDGFWDVPSQTLIGRGGDSFMLTVEYKIARVSGTQDFRVKNWIDIGIPARLYQRPIGIEGSSTEEPVTWTTGVYTLDTWEANGGGLMIESPVPVDIWDIRFVPHRLHKGRGTYPPA